jgi:3-deoxy-7-phosphoheptulonate synthase
MLIVMDKNANQEQIAHVCERIRDMGFKPHVIAGEDRVAIGITGNKGALDKEPFLSMSGVVDAFRVTKPYKLVSREVKPTDTIITIKNSNGAEVKIGGDELHLMAGPCSVESEAQINEIAHLLKASGVKIMRGGAFKPRTSPYAFQGLKLKGLELLKDAAEKTGLLVVTEVKDTESLPAVAEHSDILQIGARNMQNFSLLEAVAHYNKPVLLKRGLAATIEEFLMAAEYIVSNGNPNVIFCERGIRTYETYTRNTLDLSCVPVIQHLSHLPIIVDPSHGVGMWEYVAPMSKAAIACGANGLMIEVHPNPAEALSDGPQSLKPKKFISLLREIKPIAEAVGKHLNVNVLNEPKSLELCA